jgi:hypothetical protein
MGEMPHNWAEHRASQFILNIASSSQFTQSVNGVTTVFSAFHVLTLGKVRAEPLEARTKISNCALRRPRQERDFHWPVFLPADYRAPAFLPNASL